MNISIHLAVIRASFIMYGLNTAPCRDERLPLFIKALKINAPLSLKSQRIITIQILQHILQVCDTLHDPILCKPLYLFTFFPLLRLCNILTHSVRQFNVYYVSDDMVYTLNTLN